MSVPRAEVVVLATAAESTNIVYNGLRRAVPVQKVVLEDRISRADLVRRRAKRLGVTTVAGQLLFAALVQRRLAMTSRRRIAEIKREHGLDDSPIPSSDLVHVPSVNSPEAIAVLRALDPKVIVLAGTRILSKEALAATRATIINMHAGITPLYRGVHGAYWALAQHDPAHCGVTVHLVDAGIDTGTVLDQALIAPTDADNFATYPLLQVAAGLPLLIDAVSAALRGDLRPKPAPRGPSRLWSHPTLGQYLAGRVRYGVR